MGLGKSFVGSIKLKTLNGNVNLVICQKSMLSMWLNHFKTFDDFKEYQVYDLTNKKEIDEFISSKQKTIGVINYDLIHRRSNLLKIDYDTLLLDESSLIQNRTTKRSKAILKLNHKNIILLSGTPCSGDYSKLWSQITLLDWKISEELYWKQYVIFHYQDTQGFPIKIIDGYKNVDRLKNKLREHGAIFKKTQEVFDLPDQVFNKIKIDTTKEYRTFKKDRIVTVNDTELVGDTTLTKMLYERMLCGSYNTNKLEALKDLLQSSDDRIIIFYNFNEEARLIVDMCEELDRPVSEVNGQVKDLTNWNEQNNTVLLGQYQAASMGLNLQQANKIIYFTPPLSSELFEQSKKRISRIGQTRNCFYYLLVCKNSIEERIYEVLAERRDYTDKLFEEDN